MHAGFNSEIEWLEFVDRVLGYWPEIDVQMVKCLVTVDGMQGCDLQGEQFFPGSKVQQ